MKPSAVLSRGGLILLLMTLFFFTPDISTRAQGEETATPSETVTTEAGATLTETATAQATASLTETATSVPGDAPVINGEYVPNEILVQINPRASQSRVIAELEKYGELRESGLAEIGVYVLVIPDGNISGKIGAVQNITGMVFAEPNYYVHAIDLVPDDPGFAGQYSLTAIRAPQGWGISTGSPSVTIAIVDSGVDLGHPDLAGKIVSGYDYVNNDYAPDDDYGHGTHVAGIAAATGNNGIGIAGVSWGARVMPVKVLDAFGTGTFFNVAEGIKWAADQGAQIINLSLGSPNDSATLKSAIQYAVNRGVLVIAAAGNNGSDIVLYPARDPNVMAVAATESGNHRASYSSYGAEIDIAAPGTSIFSLYPGGGYATLSGTSMAAPYVSGLAAILFGLGGNFASARNAIESTALDVESPGWDVYTGAGLIQMDAAIQQFLPPTPTPTYLQASANITPLAGFYFQIASPTLTLASSLTPAPASATATVFVTESVSATPTSMATASPAVFPPPASARLLKRLTVFQSAPFCWGILLLLLGFLLIWLTRRRQRR